jgi:tetratricopeptide (TPR) repeat protein
VKLVIAGLLRALRRSRFGAVVLLVLSALAGTAEASPRQVERALELYQAGQLTRAMTAFERALASGDNAPADMPTIYRHLGELRAGAGDAAGAEEAFRKLLELDPSATAAAEWSPVVLEPFERARAALRGAVGTEQGGGGTQEGGGAQQGGGGTEPVRGGVEPGGGGTEPPPVHQPAPTPAHGALGPLLHTGAWTAADEPRSNGVFASPWFWGGVTAFIAAAVAAAIVASSSGGDPYLAVEGGLTRR